MVVAAVDAGTQKVGELNAGGKHGVHDHGRLDQGRRVAPSRVVVGERPTGKSDLVRHLGRDRSHLRPPA